MSRWLGRFSIRTLLCLVIVIMACMALGNAVRSLVDARAQAARAARAVTLTEARSGPPQGDPAAAARARIVPRPRG